MVRPVSGKERRHLPLAPEPRATGDGGEPPAPRPAWHWVAFGAVIVFAAWLPLALVAEKVAEALASRALGGAVTQQEVAAQVVALHGGARARLLVALVLPHAIALASAAFGGGWVIGRYGDAGPLEAALAGTVVGVLSVLLACTSAGGSWALAVVVILAAAFAALGGAAGRNVARRRIRT